MESAKSEHTLKPQGIIGMICVNCGGVILPRKNSEGYFITYNGYMISDSNPKYNKCPPFSK